MTQQIPRNWFKSCRDPRWKRYFPCSVFNAWFIMFTETVIYIVNTQGDAASYTLYFIPHEQAKWTDASCCGDSIVFLAFITMMCPPTLAAMSTQQQANAPEEKSGLAHSSCPYQASFDISLPVDRRSSVSYYKANTTSWTLLCRF